MEARIELRHVAQVGGNSIQSNGRRRGASECRVNAEADQHRAGDVGAQRPRFWSQRPVLRPITLKSTASQSDVE